MTSESPEAFLDAVASVLGPGGLLKSTEDLSAYEQGWRYGTGKAWAVARPKTTDECAAVVQLAAKANRRVQPIGANTGLVGASNPDPSGEQFVVSFERLAQTITVDPVDRSVLVDAGVTLGTLNAALAPMGLFFPVDLGADPQIGGMIATNTGGTRLLRYGAMRRHVLGLEVVLPDGRIAEDLSALRKDNRGLDWKQLFIGTSGSFGFITRARLAVAPLPRQTVTAWAALSSGDAALDLLTHLESEVGESLSAYEVLSQEAFDATLRHGADVNDPFGGTTPPFAALLELSSTYAESILDLEATLFATLESFMLANEDKLSDVTPLPCAQAWHLRHQVSESLRHEGKVLALDVSVPRARIAEFSEAVKTMLDQVAPAFRSADFGHWGDGGTHLNLVWNPEDVPNGEALAMVIQERVYTLCVEDFGGSYSAEHGVGPHNQGSYDRWTPTWKREVSALLKTHFDPKARVGTVRWGGSTPSQGNPS